jgi:hypothetical protein
MAEDGVKVINGGDSRSTSPGKEPEKPKKFQNGWSRELERLMAEWSDIAMCYRWLHDNSNKIFHTKTLNISLPVIFLSMISGFSNVGVQAILESEEAKKYASFAIAAVSLIAGGLTTVGDRLRYAQLEESHRVAAISWGKFQRLIAVELALNPNERMDSFDFLKICRGELDRMIEQSPPIPSESIKLFEKKFGTIKDLKKPDICGSLEHTSVFESSETRLKQAAVEAALMLKRRKQALTELLTPTVENRIKREIETRLSEAIEDRKIRLESEIEQKKEEAKKAQEEYDKVLEERKKKIQEEIEIEKARMHHQDGSLQPMEVVATAGKVISNQFESRLNYRRTSVSSAGPEVRKKINTRNPLTVPPPQNIYAMDDGDVREHLVNEKKDSQTDGKEKLPNEIIIVSRN